MINDKLLKMTVILVCNLNKKIKTHGLVSRLLSGL